MLVFDCITNFSASILKRFSGQAKEVLVLDIETTGFSPDSSYVYLIGAAFASGGKLHIRQWFMEEAAREKELLAAFLDFAKDYKVLAHYNGTTFDVPYLQKKCKKFHLSDILGEMQQWDIYKKLVPLKKLFGLADCKQRTVEAFMGVKRQDPFHGGDLIPVYTEFIGRYRYETLLHGGTSLKTMPESPAKALLHVLLLHNQEDLSGLLSISALLAVSEIWNGGFLVRDESEVWKDAISGEQECKYIHFFLSPITEGNVISRVFSTDLIRALPSGDALSLSAENTDGTLRLSVPIYRGTLKYFFEDYREYYYLPVEDRAVHKSVAEFVDKAYRKKATRDTCYQKKEGSFLPQLELMFTPAFREALKSGISYFEPKPDFWENEDTLKSWILSLLCWLAK